MHKPSNVYSSTSSNVTFPSSPQKTPRTIDCFPTFERQGMSLDLFNELVAKFNPICPYCQRQSVLVPGQIIYPHRQDLSWLHFWQCDPCDAFVGCHAPNTWHKEGPLKIHHYGLEPKGTLAQQELRDARRQLHQAFDRIWLAGSWSRGKAYRWLSTHLGIPFDQTHIGMFDLDTCMRARQLVRKTFKW